MRLVSTLLCTFKPVIGLEIHAQIASETKLFSRAATGFLAPPNTHVSFFDAAFPGTLPVLNKRCVEAAIMTGFAFNCNINKLTTFDRKHYFYADLPSGYQITQYFNPVASSGFCDYYHLVSKVDCSQRSVRIKQIQIEQDSGKSFHDPNETLIDLNRCGIGLLEIVTEPDFSSAAEVASFVNEAHKILVSIGVCSGRLEEGALRVDANISVQRNEEAFKGVRTEVKNLNSIKSIQRAIKYELDRQTKLLKSGRAVINETLSFDAQTGQTVSLRDKERIFDYRYTPEPNLPPLRLYDSSDWPGPSYINIDDIRAKMPKLHSEIRDDFIKNKKLRPDLAVRLVADDSLLNLFQKCISKCPNIPSDSLANFIFIEVLGYANSKNVAIDKLSSENIVNLALSRHDGRLSSFSMRLIFDEAMQGKDTIEVLINRYGVEQINDEQVIHKKCLAIFTANQNEVVKLMGKKNARPLQFLMGLLMKETKGAVNPSTANVIFQQLLSQGSK